MPSVKVENVRALVIVELFHEIWCLRIVIAKRRLRSDAMRDESRTLVATALKAW